MPNRSLSHDGKKHVVTVPVRLRRLQGIQPAMKHEGLFENLSCFERKRWLSFACIDSHFTSASLRHIKDLAGIFGNDCVFYLTQDTKAKVKIGRPAAKGQAPLIMHMDYEISSVESSMASIGNSRHQFTPW